ncbi:hypothetical protein A2U01_0065388, partial [Trifolium medium]|nr:hypothetical protein [Trifolium medium]
MAKQGPSSSRSRGNQGHKSPTPPRCNTPPRHSPPGSDEEDSRCPLSKEIMRAPIPAGFEKPPQLGTYDGQSDPDEHIDKVNAILNFRMVSGAIRCRLFPTTLRKGAM